MPEKIQIIRYFKQLGQQIKSNINHELLTYLFFLLMAIAIWYLNALNKAYTADMKFAVKYTDMPEDKVLVNKPPEHLTLTIHAQGFTLLKYRLGLIFSPIALEAGYQTLRRNNRAPQGEYFITTLSTFDRIAAQLSADVQLRLIAPDTLNCLFSGTVRKNVPVKSALQLRFDKGFLPKGNMLISPRTVTVTGPKALVDTMQYVYTQSKTFKKLKDTLRTAVSLQNIPQLRYSVDEIDILQNIERHTEATVSVPIEPINLPDGVTMKVFPGVVTVNCMVPIVDYEKLQPYLFRAVADYASIKDAKDNQAKVKLTILRAPDYVTDVKFHPKNVDFIIEK
jgi:hypothetical protein